MDSVSYDPSLLVDFDGSTNPDLLTELTWTHLEYPDGSVPMVAKNNTGRMSPVRARTMKEYDQQIAELKKENFSLKLRIYFLEDRMRQKFGGDDLFKTNIELKVESESLRKELNEKQELLKKASNAIENLTTNHQAELAKLRDLNEKEKLNGQNNGLEEDLKSVKEDLEDKNKELDYALGKSMDLESKLNLLNQKLEKYKSNDAEQFDNLKVAESQLKEKSKLLDQLNQAILTKDEFIKELQKEQDCDSEKISELEAQLKRLNKDLGRKERDLEDELEDQKENLQGRIDDLEKQLSIKDDMIGKLEDMLKKKDKELRNSDDDLEETKKELQIENEKALTRDKAIQGLIAKVQEKEKQIKSVKDELATAYDNLKKTRDTLYDAQMEKHKDIESEHAQVEELNNKIGDLVVQVENKEKEIENNVTALQEKDGELSGFKDLLRKTEKALLNSEEAVESLQKQLLKERDQTNQKLEDQNGHYQNLVEDSQRQLRNKEQVIQQLTDSLKDKDRLLNDCMDLNKSQHEGEDNLIKSMEHRLKDKDKAIEEAVEEKYKALEERERELHNTRQNLRDKEKDLDRANQMLLSAEETINGLERSNKEKNQMLKQLSANLNSAHLSMEESSNNHTQALEEKDGIIRRMQYSLDSKEKSLQEALRRNPVGSDAKVDKLLNSIREKDNLLEEVMLERSKAAKETEKMYSELMKKLKNKDKEMKTLMDKQNEELGDVRKEMQKLQTDLNKKDYELMTLENKMSWAEGNQKSSLDKLRTAIEEKDKTIEALVASGREKDRLIQQVKTSKKQSNGGADEGVAEVHKLRDELAYLKNELQNKDIEIGRLKCTVNKSPRNESTFLGQELDNLQKELAKKSQDLAESRAREDDLSRLVGNLRHQLAMKSGPTEINTLKKEIIHINERHLDSEHTKDRIPRDILEKLEDIIREQMAELKTLNKLLQAERQIYVNLSHTYGNPNQDPCRTFEEEIKAVHALRCQLEEGIGNNLQLRKELQKQAAELNQQKPSTLPVSLEEKSVIERLQEQLNEAEDSNQALRVQLNQLQSGGDCRPYNGVDVNTSPIPLRRKSCGVGAERSLPTYTDVTTSPITSHRTVFGVSVADISPYYRDFEASDNPVNRRSFGVGEGIASPHFVDVTTSPLHRTGVPANNTFSPKHNNSTVTSSNSLSQRDITPSFVGNIFENSDKSTNPKHNSIHTSSDSLSQRDITPSLVDSIHDKSVTCTQSVNGVYGNPQVCRRTISEADGQLVSSPDFINRNKDTSNSDLSPSFTTLSLLPSSTTLASAYLSPDSTTAAAHNLRPVDQSLSQMSAPMLRRMVQQLQGDLLSALHDKDDVLKKLNSVENMRNIPGKNEEDGNTIQMMRKEFGDLQSIVHQTQSENRLLRSKFGIDDNARIKLSELPNFSEVEFENARLKDSLKSSENLNALLKRQVSINTPTEKLSKGVNTGLVIQMANEIERLKEENRNYKSTQLNNSLHGPNKKLHNSVYNSDLKNLTTNALEGSDSNNSDDNKRFAPVSNRRPVIGGSKGSQIPRLQRLPTTSRSSPDVIDSGCNSRQWQLMETQAKMKDLERKLAATEGTVRFQAQKMKYYKGLLMDNGLLCKGPVRSCSESNLSLLGSEPTCYDIPPKTLSVEDLSELSSLPPMNLTDPFIHFGLTNNIQELRSQVRMLKKELDGVKKDIKLSLRNKLARDVTSPGLRKSPFGAESSPPHVTFGQTVEYTDYDKHPEVQCFTNQTTQTESSDKEMNKYFRELNEQIHSLKLQLQDSQEWNNKLRQNVKSSSHSQSPSSLHSVLESQKNEISSLKKKLAENQNLCSQLQRQLETMEGFLSDIVGQRNIDSDLSFSVDSMQEKLDQSKDTLLALSMNTNFPTGDENTQNSSAVSFLQDRLQRALERIDDLKHNMSLRVSEELRPKNQEIEYLRTQLSKLKVKNMSHIETKEKRKETDTESMISSEYSHQQRISSSIESEDPAVSEFKENIPPDALKFTSGFSNHGDTNIPPDTMKLTSGFGNHGDTSHFGHSIEKLRHRTASGNSEITLRNNSYVDVCDSSVPSTILSSRINHLNTLDENDESVFENTGTSNNGKQVINSYNDYAKHVRDTSLPHFTKAGTPVSDKTVDFSDSEIEGLSETGLDNGSITDSNSIMDYLGDHTFSRSPSNEVEDLKAQLTVVEEMDNTLKDGLHYCEGFFSSVGVQCSPHGSFITTRQSNEFDSNFMEEHFRQMQAWRSELAKSQAASENLRHQLEDKLSNQEFTKGTVTNIFIRGRSYDAFELEKLIERLTVELREKTEIIKEKTILITEREKIIKERNICFDEAHSQNKQYEVTINIFKEKLEEEEKERLRIKKLLLEKDDKISELENDYKHVTSSLNNSEACLREKTKLLKEKDTTIEKLQVVTSEKERRCSKLTEKKEKIELMIKKAVKEIKRLKFELSNKDMILMENRDLNKTLKLEISCLEKLQQQKDGASSNDKSGAHGFDISEYYAELRRLRVQIERCVDTNNNLRQKLEEVLSKESPPPSSMTNIHYVNDNSVSSSQDDADRHDVPNPHGKPRMEHTETHSVNRKLTSHTDTHSNEFGSRDTNLDGDEDSGVADNGAPKSPNLVSTWPPTGHASSVQFSNLNLSRIVPDGDMYGSSVYSTPKTRSASENNLSYRVYDPPGYNDLSFSMVDSDLRNLFAIGKLDDFELLKKQNNESCVILKGLEARIKDRLKIFKAMEPAKSIEYSTLKEINRSVENTQMCLNEATRLIGCFWTSQLPPKNGDGEFYDPKALAEIDYLRKELERVQARYQKINKLKDRSDKRLNSLTKQNERTEIQLQKTLTVMVAAKKNFTRQAVKAGYDLRHMVEDNGVDDK